MTPELSNQLLIALLEAEKDPLDLLREHGLSPAAMAEWRNRKEVAEVLATFQAMRGDRTATMTSRCQPSVILRLARLATEEENAPGPEIIRKTCVNVLEAEVKPSIAGTLPTSAAAAPKPGENGPFPGEVSFRDAFYAARKRFDDDRSDPLPRDAKRDHPQPPSPG